jgi:hypothetical protein
MIQGRRQARAPRGCRRGRADLEGDGHGRSVAPPVHWLDVKWSCASSKHFRRSYQRAKPNIPISRRTASVPTPRTRGRWPPRGSDWRSRGPAARAAHAAPHACISRHSPRDAHAVLGCERRIATRNVDDCQARVDQCRTDAHPALAVQTPDAAERPSLPRRPPPEVFPAESGTPIAPYQVITTGGRLMELGIAPIVSCELEKLAPPVCTERLRLESPAGGPRLRHESVDAAYSTRGSVARRESLSPHSEHGRRTSVCSELVA